MGAPLEKVYPAYRDGRIELREHHLNVPAAAFSESVADRLAAAAQDGAVGEAVARLWKLRPDVSPVQLLAEGEPCHGSRRRLQFQFEPADAVHSEVEEQQHRRSRRDHGGVCAGTGECLEAAEPFRAVGKDASGQFCSRIWVGGERRAVDFPEQRRRRRRQLNLRKERDPDVQRQLRIGERHRGRPRLRAGAGFPVRRLPPPVGELHETGLRREENRRVPPRLRPDCPPRRRPDPGGETDREGTSGGNAVEAPFQRREKFECERVPTARLRRGKREVLDVEATVRSPAVRRAEKAAVMIEAEPTLRGNLQFRSRTSFRHRPLTDGEKSDILRRRRRHRGGDPGKAFLRHGVHR